MPIYENEAQATANLQRYLRQLSYHHPEITPPPIDGIFERDTEESLKDFQTMVGLPITGRADRRTWDALYAMYRASIAENEPPRTVAILPFVAGEILLQKGDEGFTINVLQYMLRELGESLAELEEVEITGIFDNKTARAVRLFRKQNGLPEGETVDLITWNTLVDRFNRLGVESV